MTYKSDALRVHNCYTIGILFLYSPFRSAVLSNNL